MSERTTAGIVADLREFAELFRKSGLAQPDEIGTADQCEASLLEAADALEAAQEAVVQERHLGQLMYFAQQRWQSMAEDLWEYIQEWHIDSCSMHWINGAGMHPECSCHRVMEAKWNELVNADDWADFAEGETP